MGGNPVSITFELTDNGCSLVTGVPLSLLSRYLEEYVRLTLSWHSILDRNLQGD